MITKWLIGWKQKCLIYSSLYLWTTPKMPEGAWKKFFYSSLGSLGRPDCLCKGKGEFPTLTRHHKCKLEYSNLLYRCETALNKHVLNETELQRGKGVPVLTSVTETKKDAFMGPAAKGESSQLLLKQKMFVLLNSDVAQLDEWQIYFMITRLEFLPSFKKEVWIRKL